MGYSRMLEIQTSEIKLSAKSLQHRAHNHEKEEKAEIRKVKKAMKKGKMDEARICAQKAIYEKTEKWRYLHLSSRLDDILSFLSMPENMNKISYSMGSVVRSLESSLTAKDIGKMSEAMEQLEDHFRVISKNSVGGSLSPGTLKDSLGGRSVRGSSSFQSTTSLPTPEEEINNLMQQVADEIGLKISVGVPADAAIAKRNVLKTEEKVDEDCHSLQTCTIS